MAFRFKDIASLTKFIRNTKSYDQVLKNVNILSVGGGECTAEFKIEEGNTNPFGGLHGGFSAMLVDCISTYALLSKVDDPNTFNTSVDIHMRYLKGAIVGDDVAVRANVVRQGKNLAFLEVVLKNKNSGDILVKGSHTVYLFQKRK